MKTIIRLIAIVLVGFSAKAQDVHFTMFHAAPTVLNPAAAAVFDGTFRASTNFRTQWGSVSNPYKTFSFTAEGAAFKDRGGTAHMGIGLSAYRDVAGSTNFGTTKIDLSVSGIIQLDDKQTLSIGLKGGWAQYSMSPDRLEWDAQFNGLEYDGNLPSNESFGFESSSFFDYGAGLMWTYGTAASTLASHDKFAAEIGLAYHHLSRPQLATYFGDIDKLYGRYVFHADMQYATPYSKLALKPRVSAINQGPALEVNVGMMFRYLIKEGSKYTGNIKGLAVSLGGYYRVMDAISPSVEIELAGFTLGYSYDVNISGLTPASKARGGSEIYLKFQNPNPFFRFSRRPRFR